ncbi:MAG TPA: nucleotidyltransferase family protein [Vicinamibacterales bacterium]|nr:nucleotidyltransferase family protein [Vicinamibacterales bacterium]
MRQAEHAVASALRGERGGVDDEGAFARAALTHRVAALLVHAGAADWLPPAAAAALRDEARQQAAIWAVRHRELSRIAAAARLAAVDLMVVKGAHLAYTHYPDISARDCLDADLFVRPRDLPRLVELLNELGYVRSAANVGEAALGQTIFERPRLPGTTLDVHSRLFTAPSLAGLMDFDCVWARSSPLPRIGPGVRVPHPSDALELAVLHQAIHHPADVRLFWLYDVYLLLSRLGEGEAERFAEDLRKRGLTAWTAPLLEAQAWFPTAAGAVLAAGIRAASERSSAPGPSRRRSRARQVLGEVAALPSWRDRLRFLAAHLFPSGDYMRQTYAPGRRVPLPLLYVLRMIRGAFKRL